MSKTNRSDCYRSAAVRIATQKVALAKTIAAQRHAPHIRQRTRDIDTAKLRRILKKSELLLTQLATSRNTSWRNIQDRLDDHLGHFDLLAKSQRLESRADESMMKLTASGSDREMQGNSS